MNVSQLRIILTTCVLLNVWGTFTMQAQQQRLIITATDTTVFDIQSDEEEYKILSEFYKQTGGKNWKKNTNWLKGKTSADMANWYGVIVRDGDVSEIILDDNNLTGSVPKILYKLDGLVGVSFENNALSERTTVTSQSATARTSSIQAMSLNAASSELTQSAPVTAGKNLPVWGLAVAGPKVQKVDWKIGPTVTDLQNSGASLSGASGVAIDDCGELAFYVLHSGTDQPNQLHIFSKDGTRLTNTITGDAKQGLSAANGNIELQVVRVPGKSDEWFIIYSQYQTPCLSNPPGSGYCPAKVVYARVKYTVAGGLVMALDKRAVSISSKTFIQGKAVSRTVNGDASRQYLYLAQRESPYLKLHRFIIDAVGINFGTESPVLTPVSFWSAGVSGSAIELSPDEKRLAISNRNVGASIKQDIIIFELDNFNVNTYQPSIISVPSLKVSGTDKTVKELSTQSAYTCFRFMKNKLSQIEFSPSGRYLYCLHGGYPDGSGGKPYNTYLLQIDLQSGTGIGDYDVRMQIEKGIGVSNSCLGSSGTLSMNNSIGQIQTAYDGKLYFTKSNASMLYVIPNPDDPMPHSLVPGVVNLATATSPNIAVNNGSKVYFMPENIDGYEYIIRSVVSNFNLDKEPSMGIDERVTLTIPGFIATDGYQVSWGDGSIETITNNVPKSHGYAQKGEYTIVLTVKPSDVNKCLSITSKKLTVRDCAATVGMEMSYKQYLCAVKFSVPNINCYATYSWNFGDGTSSKGISPMHAYGSPGTYTASVVIDYNCFLCRSQITLTKQVTVNGSLAVLESKVLDVVSDQRLKVISSSATTFSDTWPLDHNEPAMENINGFINGSQGVWRSEGEFVYTTPRSSSTPVALNVDGTYTLDFFNWQNASLEAIPKWVKANTMTRYNAYSFELENQDVLGVSSAALYDYRGQLQSAHGVNMKNEEMGFTGFENFVNKPTGNLIFSNQAVPAYKAYKVNVASAYIAIIETPLQDIQDADKADIISTFHTGFSWFYFFGTSRYLQDVKILCKQAHPANPAWTILVFEQAPSEGIWFGSIRIKNRIVPVVQGVIDNAVFHTGKSSLKITADQVFEQKLLRLEANKTYYFNAWVSVLNYTGLTPKLANQLGVDVILQNKQGATVSRVFMVPDGKVIEGWQQVKGSFTCPEKDLTLALKFKPGSTGTAWYDDVRIHPENGNMKSYVYDVADYRLKAILDEDNFASVFYYDKEGNLYLTKKETEEGIKTITENRSFQVER